LQQSFSGSTSSELGKQTFAKQKTNTSSSTPPSYSAKKEFQSITYAEQQQAEKDFAEDAVQNWTNELEQQGIKNTSYQTPLKKAALIAPIAATTAPLINSKPEEIKKVPVQPPNTIVVEEKTKDSIASPSKDKPVFIDTDLPRNKLTDTAASKIKQEASNIKQSIKEVKKSAAQEKSASTEQQVATYETLTPAITPNKEKYTEKGITAKAPSKSKKKGKKTTKKTAKKSCTIIVAALQDAANIKRLIKSLESDNYKIYNKRSGKYRAIGVQTSCNPSINQPLLQTIKKNYAADAWLKTQ